MNKTLIALVLCSLFILDFKSSILNAEVLPPDYKKTLATLQDFFPPKTLEEVQKIKGNGEIYSKEGDTTIYKYQVNYYGYPFPLFLQTKEGKISSIWATLPSYFLHDLFHRELIRLYGKQNRYFKKGNSAVYVWEDALGAKLVYSGQCTITCFAAYLFVGDKNVPEETLTLDRVLAKF